MKSDVLSIEVDHSVRYLVIDLAQDAQLCDYQLEMLKHNPHPGILPVEKRIDNQEINLYYKLVDKISFTTYFKSIKPEREQILTMLENLTAIILDSKNYLLYPEGFLLDLDYLFINPRNMDVSMVYYPLTGLSEFPEKLQALIREILRQGQTSHDLELDLEKFLNCLNTEHLNLAELRMLCREIKYKMPRQMQERKPFKLAEPEIQFTGREISRSGSKVKQRGGEGDNKLKNIAIFSAVQAFYVLVLILAAPLFYKLGDNISIYFIIGVALIFLNIVILKKIFSAENSKKG